jgi:hypothetical protein
MPAMRACRKTVDPEASDATDRLSGLTADGLSASYAQRIKADPQNHPLVIVARALFSENQSARPQRPRRKVRRS